MNKLIHISFSNVYQFEHITFEIHSYCGALFLRRCDHEPKNNQIRPMRDYAALSRFLNLTHKEKTFFKIV